LLIDDGGGAFDPRLDCVSDGIIADGCRAPRTNEPANVVIELLGVVVDDEDDDDDAVFATAFVKRNGTSSVK